MRSETDPAKRRYECIPPQHNPVFIPGCVLNSPHSVIIKKRNIHADAFWEKTRMQFKWLECVLYLTNWLRLWHKLMTLKHHLFLRTITRFEWVGRGWQLEVLCFKSLACLCLTLWIVCNLTPWVQKMQKDKNDLQFPLDKDMLYFLTLVKEGSQRLMWTWDINSGHPSQNKCWSEPSTTEWRPHSKRVSGPGLIIVKS